MNKKIARLLLSVYEKLVDFRTPQGEGVRARWGNYHRNGYQNGVRREITRFLKPGDIGVDVGANIGCIAREMARCVGKRGKVIALEPNPIVFDLLSQNVRKYRQVECLPVAAGREDSVMSLQFVRNETGRASLIQTAAFGVETVDVKVRRLDRMLEDRGIKAIDCLKIDVEGFELSVLAGLAGMDIAPPEAVIIEFNGACQRAAGKKPIEFWSWFSDHNYSLFSLCDSKEPTEIDGLGHFLQMVESLDTNCSIDILGTRKR